MPEYLLELYVSASGSTAAGTGADRVREAAETVTSHGASVRYLRSMFVAAEETCFVLLEADTIETIQDVARLAGVQSNRVSEVARLPEPRTQAATHHDKDKDPQR
jgi:hypothetical protein